MISKRLMKHVGLIIDFRVVEQYVHLVDLEHESSAVKTGFHTAENGPFKVYYQKLLGISYNHRLLNMKKSNSFYGRKGGNTQYSKAYPTPQTYSTPQYSTPQTLSARIGEIPRDMPTESVEESPAESEVWDPATEACPAA